jgi:glycosyltransferase involved in cell wall biosynthesis
VPFIVTHERTALLVPSADDAAMAAAVERLIDDQALYERLRSAGLAEVQRYRWEAVRGLLLSAYREAIRTAGSRAHHTA